MPARADMRCVFLLLMTRTLTQAAGRGQQFGAALMLTLPLALMLFFAVRLTKESEGGVLGALCALRALRLRAPGQAELSGALFRGL